MRVTAVCEWCGQRFEMDRSEIVNTTARRRFCRPGHRAAARLARQAAGRPCTVCGGVAVRRQGPAVFCAEDWALLWRTCTSKWQSDTQADALDTHGPEEFAAYECPICGFWHRTSDLGPDVPERRARQVLMGERLREAGYVVPRRVWIGVSVR